MRLAAVLILAAASSIALAGPQPSAGSLNEDSGVSIFDLPMFGAGPTTAATPQPVNGSDFLMWQRGVVAPAADAGPGASREGNKRPGSPGYSIEYQNGDDLFLR